MLYGLLNLSLAGYIVATLLLTHITILGVTIFLHRCQTHRAVDLHPIVSHFFRFWLWLTTGMRTKEWVAVHRKHHAKCEMPEDPHSPKIFGLKKIFFQGALVYRLSAKDPEVVKAYGHGIADDWIERHLYSSHDRLGVSILLVADLILFGLPGILIWAIQMIWIPFFAAGVINGIGHCWGYRNFETPDASTNVFPLAIFVGGEELHNNHHAYPASAKLSMKWWEIDLGWFYIRLLQVLGLAKVKRVAPKLYQIPNKTKIDLDTLTSIFTGRLQILARYSKDVLLPVFLEEQRKLDKKGRNLLLGAKQLLLQPESSLDAENKQKLAVVLDKHYLLRFVYKNRSKLQAIWEQTTTCQQELLKALESWCVEAETAGINYLENFARHLRGCSLQRA